MDGRVELSCLFADRCVDTRQMRPGIPLHYAGTSKTLTPLEVRWMDGLARLGRHGADPSVFSQGHPTFHFLVLKQHFFPLRSYHCFIIYM